MEATAQGTSTRWLHLTIRNKLLADRFGESCPYAKKYPGRVFSGIFSNAMARMFDLMPFVAIGYSIDYFTVNKMSGPELLQDFVIAIPGNVEIGYGFLIFLGFFFLAFFQGLSRIFLANTGLQNSTRLANGCNKINHFNGSLIL